MVVTTKIAVTRNAKARTCGDSGIGEGVEEFREKIIVPLL